MRVKAGFIVFGVHKDGLKDPMGMPFIDEEIIRNSKEALSKAGIDLIVHDVVIASKKDAKEALLKMKSDQGIDCVILFSGTWVWAGNLIGAINDFAKTGKGILIWTHPGSQGWRPVGGLVMAGALKEIGVYRKFVYGRYDDQKDLSKIVSFCKAAALKNSLNMTTVMSFGGRGVGQTCGVCDPSQWMKVFGIDIDSRDTTALLSKAMSIDDEKIKALMPRVRSLFGRLPQMDDTVKN